MSTRPTVVHNEWGYVQAVLKTLMKMQGYMMAKGEKVDSDLYVMLNTLVNQSEDRLERLLKEKFTR